MFVPVLKDYLARVRYEQNGKPESERNHVPSLFEMAQSTGVSYSSVHKIATGKTKQLNLSTAQSIIEYMKSLGHEMRINDFFEYRSS